MNSRKPPSFGLRSHPGSASTEQPALLCAEGSTQPIAASYTEPDAIEGLSETVRMPSSSPTSQVVMERPSKPKSDYRTSRRIPRREHLFDRCVPKTPPCHNRSQYADLTMQELENHLTPKGLHRLGLRVEQLKSFWSAAVDPLVTRESLGELDLSRIVNDVRLRHDLQFDHEIAFRPNMIGSRGLQKKQEGKQYWEAMTIELDLYLQNQREDCLNSPLSRPSDLYVLQWKPPLLHKGRQRLPRMLVAVREIVKTLVPGAHWFAVDERFDIDLRMQELENGICDLTGLLEWLGRLLLESCSPLRDPLVTEMMSVTKQGITSKDAQLVVAGLQTLFGLLETMRLDVANHQIRHLRFYLLEDSTEFERSHLSRLTNERSIEGARYWFKERNPEREGGFAGLTQGVVDLVAKSTSDFPATFVSDFDRLRSLQQDFKLCIYTAACDSAFREALRREGWSGAPPSGPYKQLFQRIYAIASDPDVGFDTVRHLQDIALEITREAYKLCNRQALPQQASVVETQQILQDALDSSSRSCREITYILRNELERLVELEAKVIHGMTPRQMLDHFYPGPLATKRADGHVENFGLDHIAKRVAHLSVLHWRVWAPILYQTEINTPAKWQGPQQESPCQPGATESALVEDAPRLPRPPAQFGHENHRLGIGGIKLRRNTQ